MELLYLPQTILRDGGQPYAETNLDRLIVEPWNFITAALFIVVALYWLFKVRKKIRKHGFLFSMIILLLIGSIGGTVYHGFRLHRVFLMMDWMPIMLITFAASVYFFIRSWGKWWPPVLFILGYFLLQGILFNSGIAIQTAINISYASMSVMILLPVLWYLSKTNWSHYRLVLFALIFFSLALFFRWADPFVLLPVGTHFLWHLWGLAAVHLMMRFVWLSKED